MTEKEFLRRMNIVMKNIEKMQARAWPIKAETFALNMFNENFRKGGFLDKNRTKWVRTKRQDRKPPTTASKYLPLKSKRQHLMSSNKSEVRNGEVTIWNDTPYAAIHNEGGRAGRGLRSVIPKRQFIGDSETLDKKIEGMILKDIEKLFKKA
ncbi:phage virion morphogenesis protein [Tannerella forsythia]|uniref:Phage virion morphogenesis family protein n=1 Tax=Tannerella forsythia TaxID=28112 RepID=A0A3P1YYW0_TANFO|nr:phage virion morphogenesis protein [Tannerella forsythia]RRD75240.1 hypothetical protein EII41_06930 [Tannerella forsythia]